MKYLDNVPAYLRDMHENNKEGQARKLLGMLLSDPRMAIVWTRLCRQVKTDIEWLRLWQEIKTALFDANPKRKPKRVEDEADDLKWIAARATELAKVIRNERRGTRDYKGFFDFKCHQFFPHEVMEINGVPEWGNLESNLEQHARASGIMREWPSMSELLDGLSAHALKRANQVKAKRVVLKDKGRWPETMFSRVLHSHLSKYSWEKRDCINATIATIASLADEAGFLKTADKAGVTAKFVRKAVTH